jgi:L-lactate dehydrogenase (cytochrome)
VLIGRGYSYGLAARGGPGADRAVEIFRADLLRTMKLLGCASVQALSRDYLGVPPEWSADPRLVP